MPHTLLDRHVRNDPLDGILSFVFIFAVKICSKLEVLSFTRRCTETGHKSVCGTVL